MSHLTFNLKSKQDFIGRNLIFWGKISFRKIGTVYHFLSEKNLTLSGCQKYMYINELDWKNELYVQGEYISEYC